MEDFNSETDSDYTSYWRDWVTRRYGGCWASWVGGSNGPSNEAQDGAALRNTNEADYAVALVAIVAAAIEPFPGTTMR
ncbi:hypothetical protein N7447_004194 [Penicillium robsamsonii]|uniref:uncharacterized protein n=1 Tax=Penicillium robsamsonii TaxID=1792511 RepID=UPI002548400F|nr:uncharacterized protein N7447_004194 [Penicillium robsamsonii]KAJ5827431.1 hypothetical protein N7447_004194 [Penicillium robsamsonii]